jgi:hypothetical protein
MGGLVLGAVGAGEPQVERGDAGAEHGREQLEGGVDLVVAVGGGLHDLGVQAHGGVVDEHLVVDQAQVDAALTAGPTRVPGVGLLLSDLRTRPSAWRVATAATVTSATKSSSCRP